MWGEAKMEMIKTVNLHKSFGDLHVLTGVNETIHKGEVVSIIGPSGGGKSTFLRCLNLLETPEQGKIFFEGTEITGNLTKEEKKMIQNLLKLDELTAHEIMTPSAVVEMAEGNMTIREFYDSDLSHSRIPVYDDENDEYVIGYVLRQEILEKMAEDRFATKLHDILRPIMTFGEEDSVADIWEKMLEKKEHISVILDEYGSLRGIVTLEDVIETMLGHEIVDEKDEVVDMQEYAKEQWEKAQKEMIKAE